MGRELFGTDGVRGLAGQYPLDQAGATQIGRAVGALFAQAGQTIVIASDPRQSSADLVKWVSQGLTEVGVNVTLIGVLPTPGLAYVTRQQDDFVAGVMITASHNPYTYNGVKVFDKNGDKLSDETETKLNQLITDGVPDRGKGQITENTEHVKDYENFLVRSAGDLKLDGMKIAIDMANGAASGLGGRVFERLGADVTPLSESPDGVNINDRCGATDTNQLRRVVGDRQLDLGIALDGDADRLMLVDNQGREVNGDHILYILAVANQLKGVVATVMSNLGFEQTLTSKGIKLNRVKVGDRYVLDGLAKTGYKLGGEQSGHIILYDLLKTGDALLAAVRTVSAVAASGKSLADWRDEVKMLPQALVNIPLPDRANLDRSNVKEFIAQQTEQLGDRGRLLIRPSGTEPLARVMVEAPNAEALAQDIANGLRQRLVA